LWLWNYFGLWLRSLGRRWIGCDLSKFAIHLARKRLLDIPGCKPFQILNLGKYQKQKLIENGNGGERYVRFMLELYNATPLQGFAYIHGKKGMADSST
jgi:adenine-specific DNA-methyltransferase